MSGRSLRVLWVGLALAAAPRAHAQAEDLPLRFRGTAVNMSNVGRSARQPARVDIVIQRWSTPEEQEILRAALQQGDRRSLPDALSAREVIGTIREVSQIAERLTYSRRIVRDDGSQVILLATDRDIQFVEQMRSARSLDYNVSLVVLDVDAQGKGEGQIMLGTELSWDEEEQQITVLNYASQPIQLRDVRRR